MSEPSKDLERTLSHIFRRAQLRCHEFVTVEHLLLGLLNNSEALAVLRGCGADCKKLEELLRRYVDNHTDTVPPDEGREYKVQPTVAVTRLLSRTSWRTSSSGREHFGGADVVASLFTEDDSHAVALLRSQGIERIDVINFIAHGDTGKTEGEGEEGRPQEASVESEREQSESMLSKLAVNLNVEAMEGRIDPLIGRRQDMQRLMQILARRRKNNPLLVGAAGVGKTALAEGLALSIVADKVPELLRGCTIHALDIGAVLAGTRYRGDFERRFKILLKELSADPKAILFIDEIHTLIGAGSSSGSTVDASNMLKPLLGSGRLRCIGATTHEEYQGVFERDRALARRFQKIDILEPTVGESYLILKGLSRHYEEHHKLYYTDAALRSAAELSARHINDRFLPDKAIDVIDEAAASLRLKNARRRRVGVAEIEAVVAAIARIPPRSVNASDRSRLADLDRRLKQSIFGQDKALDTLAAAVRMSRAGLRDGDRPVGSFLFAGPTGVGKTEVCRQLAKVMGVELLRFDMSEYQERHTVSRLIGAPPGYVGFDRGGLLTDEVLRNPHSVVLLDEIEKAHPEVYNLLLQVMDSGTLTDNNGRKIDFRNIILVMTSNAGAADTARRSVGFTNQDHSGDALTAIEKHFTPEFRNRLDAVVLFDPLNQQVMETVADKFLAELQGRLEAHKLVLDAGRDVQHWLAVHGYDKQLGARPLKRLIQDRIMQPMADILLFDDIKQGGTIKLRVKNGELVLKLIKQSAGTAPRSGGSAKKKLARAAQ